MIEEKDELNEESSFAQRLEYARDRQRALGTWRDDAALAEFLEIAPSQVTSYKARDEAPPAKRTLAIARWCDVDPGWLAFGADTKAPAPEGFSNWLQNKRTAANERPIGTIAGSKLRVVTKSAKSGRKRRAK